MTSPRRLPGIASAPVMLPPTRSPTTARRDLSIPSVSPAAWSIVRLRRPLDRNRVPSLGGAVVFDECNGGVHTDGEFANESVVGVGVSKGSTTTVNVADVTTEGRPSLFPTRAQRQRISSADRLEVICWGSFPAVPRPTPAAELTKVTGAVSPR